MNTIQAKAFDATDKSMMWLNHAMLVMEKIEERNATPIQVEWMLAIAKIHLGIAMEYVQMERTGKISPAEMIGWAGRMNCAKESLENMVREYADSFGAVKKESEK